ncbi:acyltransferase family protein [Aquimarina sp. M1]
MQINSRNILLDIIKIIAALLVIGLHCRFLFDYNKILYQITSNGIFKIVIPLFFCINGFFLFDVFKKKGMKKWIKRVGLLYLIWMLIYSYFWIDFKNPNPIKILQTLLYGFNHLWYLIALLIAGFLLYKLQKLSNITLLIMAFFLFVIGVSIQYIGKFHIANSIPLIDKAMNFPPLHRNFLFYGLPFLNIGYVIRKTNFHTKLNKTQTLILLIVSIVLVALDSLINYHYLTYNVVLNMHISFLLVGPILLMVPFVFAIRSNINSKLLSSFSIAIYLVHPLVIFILFKFFKFEPTVLTLITIIISVGVSLALIKLKQRFFKYLV